MEAKKIFSEVGEKEVTRAIVSEFAKQFCEYVETDCLIIGGGPSGLMAGKILAEKGFKFKEVFELYHPEVHDVPSS